MLRLPDEDQLEEAARQLKEREEQKRAERIYKCLIALQEKSKPKNGKIGKIVGVRLARETVWLYLTKTWRKLRRNSLDLF